MAGLSATSGGGFDYIQSAEPADPKNAELWFDTDGGTDRNGEVKVYDGSQWDTTGYVSHDQLTNVSPGDHHDPVTVSSPLTRSGQSLTLSLANALFVDAGSLAVDESQIDLSNLSGYPVGTGDLGFDTATQSELDAVDNNLSSHESDTTNPHNVTDDQTGAAAALSNHESDTNAHHSKPTQTQSDKQTTGRHSGYQWSRVAVDGYQPEDYWTPLTGVFAEVNLKNNDGSAHDAHIRYADGSSKTVTVSANSDQWVSVDDKPLAGVGLTNQYQFLHGYNQVLHGSHSHQI